MKRLSLAALCMFSSACTLKSVDGVWVLSISPPEDPTNTFEGTENFNDFSFPSAPTKKGTSPWTVTDTDDGSDTLATIQIVGGPKDASYVLVGGIIVPGQQLGDGAWEYSWDEFDEDTHTETHESGYTYSYYQRSSSLVNLVFSRDDGGNATGTWAVESTDEEVYTETDQWDVKNVGLGFGQIPASSYLVDDGKGFKTPENTSDLPDCSNNDCEISLEFQVSQESAFKATKADWDHDDFSEVSATSGPMP